MITETVEIADALTDTAARWPGLSPAELLRRLVREGHAALRASVEAEREAVAETSGVLTGVFQSGGDLEALRADWPA